MPTARMIQFFCLIAAPVLASAQDAWQYNSAISAMTGHYADSMSLKNQTGLGIRMTAEKNQAWGFSAGLQTTRIDMQALVPSPQQTQDNWLLSGWVHATSAAPLGRWTFQLDTHKSTNDASGTNSSHVRAWSPKVTWVAISLPLKVDLSYANSKYKNTDAVQQISASVAYGFNEGTNWIQIRSYSINHLTPNFALGHTNTSATDFKFTHFLRPTSEWIPASITLGLERGQKIYTLDVDTQYIYNLPMLNRGGENIAASWKLNPQTTLNVQLSKNKYTADQPFTHHFTFSTLGIQLAKAW